MSHLPGRINIKGMWHGSGGHHDDEHAQLVYDPHDHNNGSRARLEVWSRWEGKLLCVTLSLELNPMIWKLPHGVSPDEVSKTPRWVYSPEPNIYETVLVVIGLVVVLYGVLSL